jgi:colicin import membrane protein
MSAPGSRRPAASGWRPLASSIVVHAVVFALFAVGFWWSRSKPPPPPTLAIEATVVDARTLQSVRPARNPPPPQTAPEPKPDPAPDENRQPERDAAREAERKAEQAVAAERRVRERAATELAAREQEVKRREAAAREAAAIDAAAKDAAARAAADARVRTEREADLRRQLAAEENAQRARASGAGAAWAAAIQARIQRAWLRPDSARAGLDCTVNVTQVPGGEVVGVKINGCNGDESVRQSIEAAVYRASPLPEPPDPALFERNIEVRFKPND